MALATQCPHCQTTFRVAHDQLKLRAGLVRCGACKQIFNGIENLLRLDEPRPAPVEPPPAPETTSAAHLPPTFSPGDNAPASSLGAGVDFYLPPEDDERADAEVPAPMRQEPAVEPGNPEAEAEPVRENQDGDARIGGDGAPEQSEEQAQEQAQKKARKESEEEAPEDAEEERENLPPPAPEDPLLRMTLLDISPSGTALLQADADNRPDPLDQAIEELQRKPLRGTDSDEADDEPSFVRQGRRRQRLGRTMRVALAIGSLLLLLALLAQASYIFRDQLAARVPQAQPLLQQVCAWLECQVGLPAQIDAVAIESNELQTLAPDSETLVLTVLLRNQSEVAQTWPHLELTLNDAGEKPVVRRVFSPADYLPQDLNPRLGFPPNSEQPVRLFFDLQGTKASGYRVYLFHP